MSRIGCIDADLTNQSLTLYFIVVELYTACRDPQDKHYSADLSLKFSTEHDQFESTLSNTKS